MKRMHLLVPVVIATVAGLIAIRVWLYFNPSGAIYDWTPELWLSAVGLAVIGMWWLIEGLIHRMGHKQPD